MRLRNVDKEVIYIAHIVGYKESKAIYSLPTKVYAQVNNISGSSLYEQFGFNVDYNLKILLEYSEDTKYVNEQTKFWIRTKPSQDNCNYVVSRLNAWDNGLCTIYLKNAPQNWDSIYTYSEEFGIYEIQCFLDEEKNIVKIPLNSYFNIGVNTKIWKERPRNEFDIDSLLVLIDKKQDNDYMIYYFREYNEKK